jgi:8-oxo-dGTP diphosphatase
MNNERLNDSIIVSNVVFRFHNGIEVLLQQDFEDTEGIQWSLPSAGVTQTEDIDFVSRTVLSRLVDVENPFIEQLKAYSIKDHVHANFKIKIGYCILVKSEGGKLDNFKVKGYNWQKLSSLPELAIDNYHVINFARKFLKERLYQSAIVFNLLPKKFTLNGILKIYEELLGCTMDTSNFRRKFLSTKLLKPLNEKERNVSYRPATLYEFDKELYEKLTDDGFHFEF